MVISCLSVLFICAPAHGNLILDYSFDANGGLTVADASGAGNAGTVVGNAAWVAGAHDGSGAMYFQGLNNGSDSYINVGSPADATITGPSTLSAWIKPEANFNDVRGIIVKGADPSSGEYGLAWYNGQFVFASGSASTLWSAGGVAPLDTWTFVTGVFDGTNGTIYVNGVANTTGAMNNPIPLPGDRPLYVGRWRSGFDFAGYIDDAQVYNNALSATDVQALYNGNSVAAVPEPSAVAMLGLGGLLVGFVRWKRPATGQGAS